MEEAKLDPLLGRWTDPY